MEEAKMSDKWTEQQEQYIRFLARGKKDQAGNEYTEAEFAKFIGVNERTTYRWRLLDGFAQAVFDEALRMRISYLPTIIDAQIMAAGKKGKGGDTQAFMAIMRQFGLLKADKQDVTSGGQPISTVVGVQKADYPVE